MGQFFIKRGDKIQGPATLQQLENLRAKLKATDLISENPNGPWTTWEQAESKLFPALESLPLADLDIPVATPPTTWQQPTKPQAPQATASKPTKNNKALVLGLGIGGALVGGGLLLSSIALLLFWPSKSVDENELRGLRELSTQQLAVIEQQKSELEKLKIEFDSLSKDNSKNNQAIVPPTVEASNFKPISFRDPNKLLTVKINSISGESEMKRRGIGIPQDYVKAAANGKSYVLFDIEVTNDGVSDPFPVKGTQFTLDCNPSTTVSNDILGNYLMGDAHPGRSVKGIVVFQVFNDTKPIRLRYKSKEIVLSNGQTPEALSPDLPQAE